MEQPIQNPWLGLKAYSEGTILYGRDEDTINLAQLVFHHTDSVLYGKSGIGKSSLLNANLLPMARRYGLHPITIRLDHHESADTYLNQVKNAIENSGISIKQIIESNTPTPVFWELFHCNRFFKSCKQVPLLIIIDQFEEIFTQQTNQNKRLSFFKEMADFINDIKPRILTTECSEPTSIEEIKDFDELNDINFENPTEYGAKYVEDNEIHLLFSLREDFLSEFEYHTTTIPTLKQHRFGLRPVTEKGAKEIITIPGKLCLPDNIEERNRLINKIIEFSKEGDLKQINTLLLSLTCYLLFQKSQKRKDGKLSLQDSEQLGANLLLEFYESLDLSHKTRSILEEKLIDSNGRRNTINESEIEDILPNWKELTTGDKRILQINSNNRIELVHDLLALAIYKTRKHRQKKNKGRILKIYLLLCIAILLIIGMLGSIFTFKEDDSQNRVPINPNRTIIWPKGTHCRLDESQHKYIENLYFEGDADINIKNHKNLKRIHIIGNCDDIIINNCPQLRYIIFQDSISVGDIILTQCPNLKHIYLPYKINNISSDIDIEISPNPLNTRFVYKNGILWDVINKQIKYVSTSRILSAINDNKNLYTDFPRQLYNYLKVEKDSIKYKNIWIYSNDTNRELKERDYIEQNCIIRYNRNRNHKIIGYRGMGPESVNLSDIYIAHRAFENCTKLKKIIINSNTRYENNQIFTGCQNLKEIEIIQDSSFSKSNIGHLLIALADIRQPITYHIKGKGPLTKRKDGIITYKDKPVLISDESEKRYDYIISNDTICICTRGWLFESSKNGIIRIGQPTSEDLHKILNCTEERIKTVVNNGSKVYLENDFTNGDLSYRNYFYCRNLFSQPRQWYINTDEIEFEQLADSVKQKITLVVPYGKLVDFTQNRKFYGFYDIKEASISQTIFHNIRYTLEGATSFLASEPIALYLLIIIIILIYALSWYLSTAKNKSNIISSNSTLKGFIEATAMIIVAFLTWFSTYWTTWYWIPWENTRYSYNPVIICNTLGTIAAIVILLLMHWNILYLIKGLKHQYVIQKSKAVFIILKKKMIYIFGITFFLATIIVIINHRNKEFARAKHILTTALADLESRTPVREKAALFMLKDYIETYTIFSTSLKDSMYSLLDTLAYELGYNMKYLNNNTQLKHAYCLELSPNGNKLAVGCENGIINILDVHNTTLSKNIDCRTWRNLERCSWLNDTILIASTARLIYYCNINDSVPKSSLYNQRYWWHPTLANNQIFYIPDIPGKDTIINSLSIENQRFVESGSIPVHHDHINDLHSYNNTIISCSDDNTMKKYNPHNGSIELLREGENDINHISIGCKDSIIAFATDDSLYLMNEYGYNRTVNIKGYDFKNLSREKYDRHIIYDIYVIQNVPMIVVRTNDNELILADISNSLEIKNPRYIAKNIIKMVSDSNGKQLYLIDTEGDLRLLKTDEPSQEELLETISENFRLENYKPTEGEIIKYQQYD